MSTAGPTDWIELAKRASNGLEVALLWDRSSNRVKIVVSDARLCHHLDFEIARADALHAFYHPFAHAASGPVPNGGRDADRRIEAVSRGVET